VTWTRQQDIPPENLIRWLKSIESAGFLRSWAGYYKHELINTIWSN
jgi:hypothetical protein